MNIINVKEYLENLNIQNSNAKESENIAFHGKSK